MGDLLEDLTKDDENRLSLLTSYRYMTSLETTNTYFMAAMDQLYFESPYIVDGHEKIYGEETPFNFIKGLVEVKAAGPAFKEFILEKNGIVPEVECLRVEFILNQVTNLKNKPLPNQLILEYIDNEAALAAPQHADIVQLRKDLLAALKDDCNQKLLMEDTPAFINYWIGGSSPLQNIITEV